ncbi:MAG: hypothetical protein AAB473_02155 [Patescibacteria group bacterium]
MSNIAAERKGRLASLFGAQYFKWCFGLSVAFVALSVALLLWRLFPDIYGKEVIPLHYNIHYGVDWTGMWWQIFVYPATGALVCAVNAVVSLLLVKREPMLARVVLVSTVLLTGFLFVSTVFVVLMNIVYG